MGSKEIVEGVIYAVENNSKESTEIHSRYWGCQIHELTREEIMSIIQALKQGKEIIIVVDDKYTISICEKEIDL